MYLRSIAMKGFKSFPDRTTLEFAPGVSVIVGPNGSGKSNVTDAVLWALGEQRPLSVRGQTMQDVIFSGGHGLPSRSAAEVEVVLDNSEGELGADFAELSIKRRLERSGEGEYRLNGARCRLVDVLEALSDTGLGKEMHSVVSQGRVEGVIHSRPGDRRLLIEEAAGLGKHRKRRRRAELKLARTGENLARALDVEREARSRLRPLKRQAEAAELHERLERQSVEARLELARDSARAAGAELARAEEDAAAARSKRGEVERRLDAVAARREAAEAELEAHSRAREALSERLFATTTAADRVDLRLERAQETARAAAAAAARARSGLAGLDRARGEPRGADRAAGPAERIGALEAEIAALDERSEAEVAPLEAERREAAARARELRESVEELRARLTGADGELESARGARLEAAAALEAARSEHARAAAELAAAERIARAASAAPGGAEALAERLRVERGYELAVAAALGPLLEAAVASDLREGCGLLDREQDAGGAVLIDVGGPDGADPARDAPVSGAESLLEHVRPSSEADAVVRRLLVHVWVVDSLERLPEDFTGVAVTRGGRALVSRTGELRQTPADPGDGALGRQARLEELRATMEWAAARASEAEGADSDAAARVAGAEAEHDRAEAAHRTASGDLRDAEERLHELDRAIDRRRVSVGDGAAALRRVELGGELRAARELVERAEREESERRARAKRLERAIERQDALRQDAERVAHALNAALEAVTGHRESLRAALAEDESAGARSGAELRACAREEAEAQALLRGAGEDVTVAEVRAQRARDAAEEAAGEVDRLAASIGLDAAAGSDRALGDEERADLEARVERLARRREQLGPVNPLARSEYEAAVAHVEELESQREDLETALAELERVISETDRRIRESFERTFEATAKNFEEVVAHLFPGGRGRLRLASPEGPRRVIAGEEEATDEARGEPGEEADETAPGEDEPGVEVEVTPAGKSTRRLSLLSGGEKSLVALAFLFAVFLARPCPFYVLDEVEAALDDLNIDRFLELVRSCSDRAQFIVVTHQKRTMDAADRLYGISMGGDGASKVVSRRLAPAPPGEPEPLPVASSGAA